MEHSSSSSSSSFTTTHYMISFISTALLFMSIIYWVSGCQSKDYSMNSSNAAPQTEHHKSGH